MSFDIHSENETKPKSCCFFGHRDAPFTMRDQIKLAVKIMIVTGLADCFYVGTHGNFDKMALGAVKELQREYPHIRYQVALAYPPDERTARLYGDNAVYPQSTQNAPAKFAVYDRNDWIIEQSRYVITYITRTSGGAYHFVTKARNKGLTIIPLGKQ